MARVKKNILMEGLSGGLGQQLVFRQSKGETIVSGSPQNSMEKSLAQRRVANTFLAASAAAKASGNERSLSIKEYFASSFWFGKFDQARF